MSGDIRLVFTRRTHPMDALIRFAPLSEYSAASHVAVGIGADGPLIHARGRRPDGKSGVVMQSRDEWEAIGNETVAEFRILPDVSAGLSRRVLPAVGTPFGYDGIVVRGLERALRTFLWPWARLRLVNTRIICSQLVMLLDPGGLLIPEWRDLDYGAVDPQDLLDRAAIGPSFERIR
ncbi:MAG: hypothetical protein JSV86_10500 [Gemmatimonadota bacterium]|nr:MAG: hypothetical protein JSV86_10500 [Gemmatimonadota bacterium]